MALGGGDPPLSLELSPGHVEALGTDQAEDIRLAPVFADQRRGEAESPARLDLRGEPEDSGRQEMHLVVDDQSPVMTGDEAEMGKFDILTWSIGENLVCSHCDRPDILALAGILADLVGSQPGLIKQLGDPLAHGDGVGRAGSSVER